MCVNPTCASPSSRSEIRAESWNELQDQLFHDAWHPELGRFRSRYAFRGLSDAEYALETTLMRLGGPYASLERHLLRNFRKYAHNMVERESVWHWLSVAQHHGLPTRLLDWTYSPLVAMHFATANIDRFDRDGAIWAVNYVRTHERLPRDLRERLEAEGANVFTVQILSECAESLDSFRGGAADDVALFFEPSSLDDRIVNQFALFSTLSSAELAFDEWLRRQPGMWRKIVIPASLKWEIRDKLDQANVTERVLFPGLDGLTSWLRRHYSPNDPREAERALARVSAGRRCA